MIIVRNRENVTRDCAKDATSDDYRCTKIDATDYCFYW
jgi:hypothetical protein